MSLILEALKKSEAERRLGRAPDLSTPMPVRRRPSPAPSRTVWLFGLPLLLGVGFGFALLRTPGSDPNPPAAAPGHAAASGSPVPPAAPLPSEAGAAPDAVASRAATASVPASTPESPAAAAARAKAPAAEDFASLERESTAQSATAPLDAPAPSAAAPPAPANAAPIVPVSAPSASRRPVAATAAVAAPVPDEPVSPEPEPEWLPTLDQLPAAQRDSLPPLKLTMHVFAAAPDARFVLIDGRRYAEGATVTRSLRLIEIRRDGTVMDFAGTRFLLRRP